MLNSNPITAKKERKEEEIETPMGIEERDHIRAERR
jgi:hypothetical protein